MLCYEFLHQNEYFQYSHHVKYGGERKDEDKEKIDASSSNLDLHLAVLISQAKQNMPHVATSYKLLITSLKTDY